MKISKNYKYRILIVDDIPDNIEIASTVLRKKGYDIEIALNGDEALSMIQSNEYNLILLDIMMPDMNGYDVCKKLKENPKTREIPVIFLTAKVDIEDMVKGFKVGAADYITKPFNIKEIVIRVNTHIELQKAKAALKEKYINEKKLNSELKSAFSKVKQLSGLLPICCYCKKIRDDEGYWQRVETYIAMHSEAEFTHGICKECGEKVMKEYGEKNSNPENKYRKDEG